MDFECPICRYKEYVYLPDELTDDNGSTGIEKLVLQLYKCCGCSVMFSDPIKFSGNKDTSDPDEDEKNEQKREIEKI